MGDREVETWFVVRPRQSLSRTFYEHLEEQEMGCPFWNGSRSTCVDVDVDRFEYDIIINSIKISSFLRIHLAEKVVWPMFC